MAAYYTVKRDELVDMRHRRLMTQEKLARAAGVAKQTITRMETGSHTPQFDTIKKVAKALDVAPDAIIDYHTPASSAEPQRDALPGGARNAQDLTEGLNAAAEARQRDRLGETDGREADQDRGA